MQSLSAEFKVRLATVNEVVDIISEPRLLSAVNLKSVDEIADYFHKSEDKFYLIEFKQNSLLFKFKEVCLGVFEFHVACPERSRTASRLLAYSAMKWIYLKEGHYVKYFYTNCPEGKIANFIRKFGAKEIKRTGDVIHFMATPTDFQLDK